MGHPGLRGRGLCCSAKHEREDTTQAPKSVAEGRQRVLAEVVLSARGFGHSPHWSSDDLATLLSPAALTAAVLAPSARRRPDQEASRAEARALKQQLAARARAPAGLLCLAGDSSRATGLPPSITGAQVSAAQGIISPRMAWPNDEPEGIRVSRATRAQGGRGTHSP